MKVVIAGGSGFLGAPLAEAYAEEGHDVRVLTRGLKPGESRHESGTGVPGITRVGWTPNPADRDSPAESGFVGPGLVARLRPGRAVDPWIGVDLAYQAVVWDAYIRSVGGWGVLASAGIDVQPVRWMIARRAALKIVRRPTRRGCRPSALPVLSDPICSALAAGTASVGRRA